MSQLDVRADMDESPWDDLRGGDFVDGIVTHVGLMRNGTTFGRAVVAIRVTTTDGRTVIGQVPLGIVLNAVAYYSQSAIVAEEMAR